VLPQTFVLRGPGSARRVRREELNAAAWARWDARACRDLGEQVVRAVNRLLAVRSAELLCVRVPRPPQGATLHNLELGTRARNCLVGAGLGCALDRLGGLTVGDLVDRLTYFGAKSLVDLLAALEECRPPAAARPPAPPLPPALVMPPAAAPAGCLEEELLRTFVPRGRHTEADHSRNRILFLRFHGLDGPRRSLPKLAAETGLTRQRVSQLCKARPRGHAETRLLARALEVIAASAPCAAGDAARELVRLGVAASPLPPAKVAELAGVLGLPVRFSVADLEGGSCVVAPGQEAALTGLAQRIRRAVASAGAVALPAVAPPLDAGLAARLVGDLPGLRWLDKANGWFRIDTGQRPRLAERARDLLSVTGPLPVAELRSCLCKPGRQRHPVPPPGVLLELFREAPYLHVEGGTVAAVPALDWQEVLVHDQATFCLRGLLCSQP
jgi:hypothetical protein